MDDEDPDDLPQEGRLDGLRARLQGWDAGRRSTSFVSTAEEVVIDTRRHPFRVVPAALRTIVGLLVLLLGPLAWLLVAFLLATTWWARTRATPGLRTLGIVVGGATAALFLAPALLGDPLTALVLLLWFGEDVLDWESDRLVVTDKRLYRRHGTITKHSPSMSLTAIGYLDAAVPPLGRLVGYGTLLLDSAAQHDEPLSHFDHVPDVVAVSHQILVLRTAAMPKFPQPPH